MGAQYLWVSSRKEAALFILRATETIKAGWIPVFVLQHAAMPDGNRLLLQKGGLPFPHPFPEHYSKLPGWLHENSTPAEPKAAQLDLF
jgi:hypothetical protein